MGWAVVKIKEGASCFQDMHFYKWPPSQYGEKGKKLAKVADDCIFIAKKRAGSKLTWDCHAPNAGLRGQYGNGSIFADDVEILSPLTAFQPDYKTAVAMAR